MPHYAFSKPDRAARRTNRRRGTPSGPQTHTSTPSGHGYTRAGRQLTIPQTKTRSYNRQATTTAASIGAPRPPKAKTPKLARRTLRHEERIVSALDRVTRALHSHTTPSVKGLDIPSDIARLDSKIGKKHGVAPSLLAAQQLHESSFHPGSVSSAGAFGISQFIPSTAASYGVKPGTSRKAVKSQIKGQAKYMKDLGADKDPANALGAYLGDHDPNSSYAQGILADQNKYRALDKAGKPKKAKPKDLKVLRKAQVPIPKRGAKPTKTAPSKKQTKKKFKGHYVNPYGEPTEIDQGVDYGGTGDIRTIGKAKVVDTGRSSFGGGPFLAYELLSGPRKGWTVYVAEGVQPKSGLKEGQTLGKGAVFAHQSSGIETGWAAKPGTAYASGQTLSAATGDSSRIASRHSNFTGTPSESDPVAGRDFLKFLNGKPGLKVTNVGGYSTSSGGYGGSSSGSSGSSGGGVTFTSPEGVSTFSKLTGIGPMKAQRMTPKQRLAALRKRRGKIMDTTVERTLSPSSSSTTKVTRTSTATSIPQTLKRKYGTPAV